MAAPTIIQSNCNYNTGNVTVTLGTNITVGNFLVAFGYVGEDAASFSSGAVSDNLSNVWTERVDYRGGNGRLVGIWTAPVTNGGSCTITLLDIDSYQSLFVVELSGCNNSDPIDISGYSYSAYSTSFTIDLASTTYAEDIIFAICGTANNFGTIAAGSGWTSLLAIQTPYPQTILIYRTTTSTGNYDPVVTHDGDPLLGAAIAIKGAAAGSATALPRRALDGPFYGSLRGSVR